MAIILESFAAELLIVLVILSVIVYWFLTNNFDYWEKRNVFYIKPIPLFGNSKDRLFFQKGNCEVMLDFYKQAEGHKLFGAWIIKKPFLFVRDPDIIKRILVKDFAYFHDRGTTVDEEISPLSANLFNLQGTRWRALRTKLTPTFTSGKMKMMFTLMHECAREFVDFVSEEARTNNEVEFKEVFAKLTTDIIGSCAFGLQFNSMKKPDSEFREMGRKVLAPNAMTVIGVILQFIFPSLRKIFTVQFTSKDVSDFFMKVVKDTVDYREKNHIKRNDFLQLLIELKNKGKIEEDYNSKVSYNGVTVENEVKEVELTDNLLAAQAFVFFLAGFETSSTTMSFALYELMANPHIQEKVREEIDRVLDESGGELTYDAIAKMGYLENVVNESMRKYPPVPALLRVCNKVYREPDTDVVIEEDMRVVIPIYALHNDPKYFPNPDRFDPDRFTEEEKAKRPHYVFLPFGDGPRICIDFIMAIVLESFAAEFLIAVITLCVFMYWYLTNNFDYWEKRNVHYLKPIPLFGNNKDRLLFRKASPEVTLDFYKQTEGHKIFGTWFIKKPFLFVRDPDIIKRILVKDFAYFHDRGMIVDEERSPLSANLFNLPGAKWRALRTKLTPTFTSGKMKMMFALMHECAREFVDFVSEEARANNEVEFKEVFAKLTTDIIGTCAFGLQFNSMKNPDSEFRKMGRKVFSPNAMAAMTVILQFIFPPLQKILTVQFPSKDVSDFFMKAVQDTVDYREKNNIKRNDFLQLLIELKNKGKIEDEHDSKVSPNGVTFEKGEVMDVELTDNLLAAQAFVFFLAGFETSSTTMSFALHELMANPHIQKKAREEIDKVLKESGGELTYEATMKMEYLENVVNESLRKYPPVPTLMRVCNEDYREPDTGVLIEKGTRVQIPVYALHHDPKYYPDPERFDPDRFTEEEKNKRPHYAFLPFGEGPRVCIGLRFGMLQAKLGLAALLSQFELAPSSRTPHPLTLDPKAFITASKGGIWAHVIPRRLSPDRDVTTEL